MPIWEQFPYSNTHELNLDWIINKVKDLDHLVAEAIGQNAAGTIIFANPIQWDINNSYGKYNLVLDSNYSAYLSSRDVPAGILLSDTAYWQPVGNFALILEAVLNNFATNQGNDPLASKTYAVGDLLVYNDTLYQVTATINLGYTIDPGSNCVAVTLEDLYKAMKTDIDTNTNDIATIDNNIATINNDITTINNTLSNVTEQVRVHNDFRYHINALTGDDTNDGLTASTAFKTIDKFISMSKKFTDIRCYIDSAGTYIMTTGFNMTGVSVHISATVGGVIISLPTDSLNNFSIYAAHVNIQGKDNSNHITLTAPPSSGATYGDIYSDNVCWTLKYVDIPDNRLSMYGSSADIDTCRLKALKGYNSFIHENALTITNTDPSVTVHDYTNCKIVMIGVWTTTNLSATGTAPYMNIHGSYVFIGSMILQNSANKYTYAITARYSYVCITAARLTNIGNNSQSGNDITTTNANELYNPS